MNREDIIRMAREAGFTVDDAEFITAPKSGRTGFQLEIERLVQAAYAAGAAAERKVIMDSLQKQADLATDALDRRWALEMIAAVAARSNT